MNIFIRDYQIIEELNLAVFADLYLAMKYYGINTNELWQHVKIAEDR